MTTTKYYQVGGFRPGIRWFEGDWNDKQLVDALAGPKSPLRSGNLDHSIELVLGIKHTGTSHILLSDIQAALFEGATKRRFLGHTTAADYESLSPIYFSTADELLKKLGTLKPKARKRKDQDPWDTSQANKAYKEGSQGVLRGEFENGRLFYRLLQNAVKPAIYNISGASWVQGVRILSFVCNLRAVDFRPYEERLQSPRPLDYGWAEASSSSTQLAVKPETVVHLARAEDRLLGTGRTLAPFKYGTTQTVNKNQLESIAQAHFKAFQTDQADAPTILLVHDEALARNALHELGVETSTWKSGISELIKRDAQVEPSIKYEEGSSSSAPRLARRNPAYDYESRRQRSRERSRSPIRSIKPDPDSSKSPRYFTSSRRSPPVREKQGFAPVYIVDVRAFYWTMMRAQNEKLLVEVAHKLNVLGDANSWCAGNEAAYIFQVWHTMISDVAIDEQRLVRAKATIHGAVTMQDQPPPSGFADGEDSEGEFDPNDIVQVSNDAGGDDSETDYGSDY